MQFKVGAMTDIGRKRSQNQDSFKAAPDLGLFIVADGMGGHKGGEIASQTAVQTIFDEVQGAQAATSTWNAEAVIRAAIQAANQAIHKKSEVDATLRGMGTTTTALLFKDNQVFMGHVGDSRCYLIRDHGFWQATRDHSLVQEKFRAGIITRSQMKTDQMKNIITRSVGFEENVEVDVYQMTTQPGDVFMMCSDGLSGFVEDSRVFEVLEAHLKQDIPLQQATEVLIAEANEKGGSDNITSIVVQVI
jgi:protein phosphatase